jgi:RNA polymerase sigma factor (sigma-70 family)
MRVSQPESKATVYRILRNMRSFILRRGIGPDEADDIIQEAFARLEAYTRATEVRSREAFLMCTALNLVRDRARRARTAPFDNVTLDLETIVDISPQPEEIILGRERLRRAQSGLDQLDDLSRRCLLARRVDELAYGEIAMRESMTVAAVEKRVARAVLFLAKWMDGW